MRGSTGEARQLPTDDGELAAIVDGAELLEHAVALGDGARLGRIEKRIVFHVPQAERLHAEDDAGETGALDLGIGEVGSRVPADLVVQTDTDTGAHASAAPLALIGACLADRLHLQARRPRSPVVTREASHAGVDHVDDAGDGHRRLGHVGGEDDASIGETGEDARLLAGGESRVERLDDGVSQVAPEQLRLGVADLALAGEEHEDVAIGIERRHVDDRVGHRLRQIDLALGGSYSTSTG